MVKKKLPFLSLLTCFGFLKRYNLWKLLHHSCFLRSENLLLVDLMNMLEVKMKPHFLHQLKELIYLRVAWNLYSITK